LRRFLLIGCSSLPVTQYQTVYLLSGTVGYWPPKKRRKEKRNEMPPTDATERLADYEQRYHELAA